MLEACFAALVRLVQLQLPGLRCPLPHALTRSEVMQMDKLVEIVEESPFFVHMLPLASELRQVLLARSRVEVKANMSFSSIRPRSTTMAFEHPYHKHLAHSMGADEDDVMAARQAAEMAVGIGRPDASSGLQSRSKKPPSSPTKRRIQFSRMHSNSTSVRRSLGASVRWLRGLQGASKSAALTHQFECFQRVSQRVPCIARRCG